MIVSGTLLDYEEKNYTTIRKKLYNYMKKKKLYNYIRIRKNIIQKYSLTL